MASLVRVWISFGESAMPAAHQLGEKSMVIGREESCDIPVIDPSVSRNHASIAFEAGQFVLRDHGSVNGTFVNGDAVRVHILKQADTIRFGEIVFLFEEGEVTSEMVQKIQNQSAQSLEATSSHPVRQIPVPPKLNQPVKVMISNKPQGGGGAQVGSHYTSRTIPISTSKAARSTAKDGRGNSSSISTDDAFVSYVCGCAGVFGILPALYFGHSANPGTQEEAKNQTQGLTYGYLFMFIWVVGFLFLLVYGNKISSKNKEDEVKTVLEAPVFKNGLDLLQHPLMWCPTRKQIQQSVESVPKDPKEIRRFNQIYGDLVSHWSSGLLVYQPEIQKVIPAFSEKDHLKFVIEDFLTKPNFLDYNSTVVPEKKDPIGPFLIPSLSSWMFFARDQNIRAQIERFNGEDFPWRNAYRGITWMGENFDYNASQIPLMRVMFILKPAMKNYSFSIKTREGNLNSDYNQTYRLAYYPAEYLAMIVYIDKTDTILSIQTNPLVFAEAKDERRAKSLIHANLQKIQEQKPTDESSLPSTFNLGSLFEAIQRFPLTPAASPHP